MLLNMAVVAAVAFAAALAGTGLAVRLLRARAILDHPNDRSSHAVPVPRGGGIVVTAVIIVHWALIWLFDATTDGFVFTAPMPILLLLTILLAGLSWQDDRHGLSAGLRFAVQAVCVVAATLTSLSAPGLTFQGILPPLLDQAATAFLWLWFINLTNFMDGIDGITGSESASIGIGIVLLALAGAPIVAAASGELPVYAAALVASALGFLCFWLLAISGIYLYVVIDTSADGAYRSIERLAHVPWYAAGWLRSLHVELLDHVACF